MINEHPWPKFLPRFAESFRVVIDHEHGYRLLTGEWQSSLIWGKIRDDYCPSLSKAGRLGFIACTSPEGVQGQRARREWYGDPHYPVIYWYSNNNEWAWPSDDHCLEFCKRRNVKLGLLKLPIDVRHVPIELRKTYDDR